MWSWARCVLRVVHVHRGLRLQVHADRHVSYLLLLLLYLVFCAPQDELLSTELLFRGLLTGTPEEAVALMSALVFQVSTNTPHTTHALCCGVRDLYLRLFDFGGSNIACMHTAGAWVAMFECLPS